MARSKNHQRASEAHAEWVFAVNFLSPSQVAEENDKTFLTFISCKPTSKARLVGFGATAGHDVGVGGLRCAQVASVNAAVSGAVWRMLQHLGMTQSHFGSSRSADGNAGYTAEILAKVYNQRLRTSILAARGSDCQRLDSALQEKRDQRQRQKEKHTKKKERERERRRQRERGMRLAKCG